MFWFCTIVLKLMVYHILQISQINSPGFPWISTCWNTCVQAIMQNAFEWTSITSQSLTWKQPLGYHIFLFLGENHCHQQIVFTFQIVFTCIERDQHILFLCCMLVMCGVHQFQIWLMTYSYKIHTLFTIHASFLAFHLQYSEDNPQSQWAQEMT